MCRVRPIMFLYHATYREQSRSVINVFNVSWIAVRGCIAQDTLLSSIRVVGEDWDVLNG